MNQPTPTAGDPGCVRAQPQPPPRAGLPTVFTETGGMCAARQVTLDTVEHLLITDADDTLALFDLVHRVLRGADPGGGCPR